MKKHLLILVFFVLAFAFQAQADPQSDVTSNIINAPMSSDGYQIGDSATSKIGFYGETPIIQSTTASQSAVATTTATSTTPFGYTEDQANSIVDLLNEIRSSLVNLGLIKGE